MKKPNPRPPAKLPHDPLTTSLLHVNYRLYGSIPKQKLKQLQERKEYAHTQAIARFAHLPQPERSNRQTSEIARITQRYELELDIYLDLIRSGPFHLQNPAIANCVMDSWKFLHATGEINLRALCIMGNHVHGLLKSGEKGNQDLGDIMRRHKGYTARMAGKIMNRTGGKFWDRAYFDRRVRTGKQLTALRYVVQNPVKAGMVDHWKDHPFTYVNPQWVHLLD